MRNQYFNTVVKKILKSKGKIINTDKIKKIVENILESEYNDKKCYKIIYYLKNRGYIISLKKDIFFVKSPEEEISEDDIIDKHYWAILKTHCRKTLNNDRHIGGIKALELNFLNFDVPDEIDIINMHKQSRESVLSNKFIKFKKYTTGKDNLFRKFKKHTTKVKVGKTSLNISKIEIAILETLFNPDFLNGKYEQELVKKVLRKYKKNFDFSIIEDVIKLGKHHTSINRLYKIARSIDPKFSEQLLAIIKRFSFVIDT